MVSVSADNALLLSGSVVTKKAIIFITFFVLGLALDVQAAVSGNISEIVRSALPSLNSAVALDSSFSAAPSTSSTSSTVCLNEAIACFVDENCNDCVEQLDDDVVDCVDSYYGCDVLWDGLCCIFAQGRATCADNEPLFDLVRECSFCSGGSLWIARDSSSDVYVWWPRVAACTAAHYTGGG